jgi:hypothetical protein
MKKDHLANILILTLFALLGFAGAAAAADHPVGAVATPAVASPSPAATPALDLEKIFGHPQVTPKTDFLDLLTPRYVCVCASDDDCPVCPNGQHRICDPEGCGRLCLPC